MEANDYLTGENGKIEDPVEARNLFEQAAKLGSGEAHANLGRIYELGLAGREDDTRALEYYKQAVRLGFYSAYANMARVFADRKHRDNYEKCADLLVGTFNERQNRSDKIAEIRHVHGLWTLMQSAWKAPGGYPVQGELRKWATEILAVHQEFIDYLGPDDPMGKRTQERVRGEVAWLKAAIRDASGP